MRVGVRQRVNGMQNRNYDDGVWCKRGVCGVNVCRQTAYGESATAVCGNNACVSKRQRGSACGNLCAGVGSSRGKV